MVQCFGQVDVVFIDFSKALDLFVMISSLYKFGVHGDLLNWCRDYLTRCQEHVPVIVKGEASDWLTMTSDVPQCSSLEPLFFIIYINDLPGLISKVSSIVLYTDNSKMYKIINTKEDLSTF